MGDSGRILCIEIRRVKMGSRECKNKISSDANTLYLTLIVALLD